MKLFFSLLCMTSLYLGAADPSAAQILEKSIQYHDPNGEWSSLNTTFILEETRPSGEIRKFEVAFNLPNQSFRYEKKDDENHIIKTLEGETCGAWFNGSTQFSKEIEEKHRLSCDRIKWFRNYYLYLYGLPMKLTDPGTILDPKPEKTQFMGKDVWSLKVTYEPGVGGEVWLFYVDPESFALTGCRFYRKDVTKDGEYIIYEEETKVGTMRLPKNRTWHMNVDGKLLGTDILAGSK